MYDSAKEGSLKRFTLGVLKWSWALTEPSESVETYLFMNLKLPPGLWEDELGSVQSFAKGLQAQGR